MIVIGTENSGKSSLLENITKCQVFPRDSKICTRCPIHLKLGGLDDGYTKGSYTVEYKGIVTKIQDKQKIYETICKYMANIKSDSISDEVITININDIDLPKFEFIDLPGIVAYPPAMTASTTALCKKYLQDRNAIVLCVVPATQTSLSACQSIALIKELNMQNNCILALTMCDRLQSANIEDLLIRRIISENIIDENDELADIHFYSKIGIVNRLHTDEKTLDTNDKLEQKWFKKNIIDCIPDEYADNAKLIENNLSVDNLLDRMDQLYDMFIRTEWKPSILKKIKEKHSAIKAQYEALGSDKLSATALNDIIMKNIIEKLSIDRPFGYGSKWQDNVYEFVLNNGDDLKNVRTEDLPLEIGCIKIVVCCAILDDKNKFYGYDRYIQRKNMIEIITRACDEMFTDCITNYIFWCMRNESKDVRLERFTNAFNIITANIRDEIKQLHETNEEYLIQIIQQHNETSYITHGYVKYDVQGEIFKYYKLYILDPLLRNFKVSLTDDDYVESEDYQHIRENIKKELDIITTHLTKINGL